MGRMEMGFLEIRIPKACTVTGWSEFGHLRDLVFGIYFEIGLFELT